MVKYKKWIKLPSPRDMEDHFRQMGDSLRCVEQDQTPT